MDRTNPCPLTPALIVVTEEEARVEVETEPTTVREPRMVPGVVAVMDPAASGRAMAVMVAGEVMLVLRRGC